jgi:hypothetical protein
MLGVVPFCKLIPNLKHRHLKHRQGASLSISEGRVCRRGGVAWRGCWRTFPAGAAAEKDRFRRALRNGLRSAWVEGGDRKHRQGTELNRGNAREKPERADRVISGSDNSMHTSEPTNGVRALLDYESEMIWMVLTIHE